MKITEVFNNGRSSLSFEVFPPKTSETFEKVRTAALDIAALKPDFMSVTYGAGGGTSEYTVAMAKEIQDKYNVPALAHLTCVNSTKEKIDKVLLEIKNAGIENIMALRGDIPKEGETVREYAYACLLMEAIKKQGDFCIGGACYPEGHPESGSIEKDIEYLKAKEAAGCDFFTTQMFFDNETFYKFAERVRAAGIKLPIVAGIMPVTSGAQVKRIGVLSGAEVPKQFVRIVERFSEDNNAMFQAGIAFTSSQIIDLMANGFNSIHIYSMNKPDVAKNIFDNVTHIVNVPTKR